MGSNTATTQQQPPNFAENTAQRVPCMLVLDASASMNEKDNSGRARIDLLNEGLVAFHEELQKDEVALGGIQIAAIRVGGVTNEASLILEWTDAVNFIPFKLKAGSLTPLGGGTLLALETIEKQKAVLQKVPNEPSVPCGTPSGASSRPNAKTT